MYNFKTRKDLTGKIFGYLKVVSITDKKDRRDILWDCVCVCGKHTLLPAYKLNSGNTKSCGCKIKERSDTTGRKRTYNVWRGMLERCSNLCPERYAKNYFGKGVKLEERWLIFDNFVQDMGFCPDKMEIDRIDSNGDYTKLNCRWVTQRQQVLNRGRKHIANSTSYFKGVSKTRDGKYQAMCNHKYIGRFKNEEDAALAYNEAAKKEYGEYAYLNKVKQSSHGKE